MRLILETWWYSGLVVALCRTAISPLQTQWSLYIYVLIIYGICTLPGAWRVCESAYRHAVSSASHQRAVRHGLHTRLHCVSRTHHDIQGKVNFKVTWWTFIVNSFGLSGTIWLCESWSKLAQVFSCLLFGSMMLYGATSTCSECLWISFQLNSTS